MFLVVVQMVDCRALPESVGILSLLIPFIVVLGVLFCLGLLLTSSPRTWTPAAVSASGAIVGFASPLFIYCSYEVYRNHGQDADIFWIMQIVAIAPWSIFPVALVLALGAWVGGR